MLHDLGYTEADIMNRLRVFGGELATGLLGGNNDE
jgi:hypothetical protein